MHKFYSDLQDHLSCAKGWSRLLTYGIHEYIWNEPFSRLGWISRSFSHFAVEQFQCFSFFTYISKQAIGLCRASNIAQDFSSLKWKSFFAVFGKSSEKNPDKSLSCSMLLTRSWNFSLFSCSVKYLSIYPCWPSVKIFQVFQHSTGRRWRGKWTAKTAESKKSKLTLNQ